MAHLWVGEGAAGWAVMPLGQGAVSLAARPPVRCPSGGDPVVREGEAIVLCSGGAGGVWALVAGQGSDVRVNGSRLTVGIRILADRDEITVGAGPPVYFSTERLAAIEEFAATGPSAYCPRCKQVIAPGLSVRCPGCGVLYHQSAELPCWTYSDVCALCPQSTDMGAGYQWSPEVL